MKPYLREKKSFSAAEIPEATAFEAGYLVSVNSGWRSIRPVIDTGRCVGCEQCYLYCPDGVISVQNGKAVVDYDFCKGCGICAKICKLGAIRTEAEHK
ncbi:MAG: 4Fe-4S binding protein [Oscillospiraceae bacterium]|nr:4Fe-4S binding protein [Oscillospiraceae bacterium]MBR5363588.1 4Fe-4S binding protein [Oscillospiraceae bacterium]